MSIYSYFSRFRRRAKPAAKARRPRPSLGLEILEDRLVPSTLSTAGGVATYQATAGEVNSLEIRFDPTTNQYSFTETGGVGIVMGGTLYSTVNVAASLVTKEIDVNLSDMSDTVKVLSTNVKVSIDGGAGNDVAQVGDDSATGLGMENVTAPVLFDGGAQTANGKDKLVLADRNAPFVGPAAAPTTVDYFLNGGAVTRQRLDYMGKSLGFVMHSGTNVEEIDLNASNRSDSIGVSSILAGTQDVINAGDGNDSLSVGSMDLLGGGLTVDGQGGNDTLTVNDFYSRTDRNYFITTDKVSQGAVTINLASLEGLTINASNNDKNNTFTVQSTTALMPLTLNGGIGNDTVTIDDTALAKAIQTYNFNAGSLERWTSLILLAVPTAYVNYNGVEKMIVKAGPSNDMFKMTDTAQPDIVLNGGTGVNTLDYSTFKTNVTVNLALGTANKISSLSNVDNVNGGDGNDIIVGNANGNVLNGNGGRDVIFAGAGADTVNGGADEDLVVPNATDFDMDEAALKTIRSTWADTSKTTQDRVNALRNGVVGTSGTIQLNDTTLHLTAALDDGAIDRMSGGDTASSSATDWIWAYTGTTGTSDIATLGTGDILN